MKPHSFARATARRPAPRWIEIVVTALVVYLALSIGVMQLRNAPTPLLHSAATAETLVI